ncbi:MAG: proline-rich domain-containing protein [Lachnospiraceae bacterium]|nr:proline-rich domain-containing protein [Lachnospiraceae bacterium]
MYKKKQFLAMCLAGLCSTTAVSNVYSVTSMAATAASQTTETSAAGTETNPGGNPPSGNPGETPPAKPDGDSGNPPAKPDGDNSNPQDGGGNPPSGENGKPGNPPSDGNGQGGNPPSGGNGSSGDGSSSSGNPQDGKGNPPSDAGGKPGDGQGPQGNPPDGQPGDGQGQPGNPPDGKGGPNTQSYDYTGTLSGKLTADGEEVSSDNETISTSTVDENAALAENGGTLKITNGKLQKSGDDTNGDNCNFYGINSILLAVGEKSKAYISNSALASDSEGSNAIFSTDGATVYSEKNSITTTKGNSRGLDATYGGTIIADDMTIDTAGDHSASLATDRGGGNISVTNSTLHTSGSGSPLIYSTGAIELSGVSGTAEGSQIAGMEGLNHIKVYDSELSSTITDRTASDPVANGVIIYQSTSGDADTSTGERAQFQAVDSTLRSKIESGAMFYVTNTSADILLSGTTLDFDSTKAKLLQIEGNDANNWGRAGSNGADVSFTSLGETLTGDISVDSISSLDLYLLSGTRYTGQILSTANAGSQSAGGDAAQGGEQTEGQGGDPTAKGAAGQSDDQTAKAAGQDSDADSTSDDSAATITVNLDQDSTWVVTGDTTVFALNAEDGAQIIDEDGKTVTIIADGTTVVKGDSDLTVTVTGSYSQSVRTSEANSISASTIDRSDFDDYYGTSTTFGTDGLTASTPTENKPDASAIESPVDTQPAPSTEAATETSTQQSTTPWAGAGVIILAAFAGITTYLKKRK